MITMSKDPYIQSTPNAMQEHWNNANNTIIHTTVVVKFILQAYGGCLKDSTPETNVTPSITGDDQTIGWGIAFAIQADLPAKAEGSIATEANEVTETTEGTITAQDTQRSPGKCRRSTPHYKTTYSKNSRCLDYTDTQQPSEEATRYTDTAHDEYKAFSLHNNATFLITPTQWM